MKISPRTLIIDAASALEKVMLIELASIGDAMISKIIGRARGLTPSTILQAIKDVPTPGEAAYKKTIQEALAEIALEAIAGARGEIPGMKRYKFVEELESLQLAKKKGITTLLEELPPGQQKFIKKQAELLVTTQIADLSKNLSYQFLDSHDTTNDLDIVEADLREAALRYVEGQAPKAGAGLLSSKTVNEARSAFFFEPDVLEELDAFEFVNGDPVTLICQDLAGTVFAKDDPEMFRYTPPLHWNCKSYIKPILKGKLGNREIERLKPSTKKIEETIQFSEIYLTTSHNCLHH